MALLYLDSSAVMAAFLRETVTPRVQDFLARHGTNNLAISAWVKTEFSSALALRARRKEICAELFASAHAALEIFAQSLAILDIGSSAFDRASEFCRRYEQGLRAGDALHLAVAAAHGCSLVTLDKRLAGAAPAFGVAITEI